MNIIYHALAIKATIFIDQREKRDYKKQVNQYELLQLKYSEP
jgi:hypothetical protein